MLVFRPVREGDLDALVALTDRSTYGLTSLPKDRALLAKRVRRSLRGFAKDLDEAPAGEDFMFVLQDQASAEIVGVAAIVSKVGGFEPFYAYRVQQAERTSEALGITKTVDVLHLVADHSGPSEIGSLLLDPDWRGGGNGRLLSLSRFLFMADFPGLFEAHVIAEMRGVVDEAGRSPFWEGLGQHFFDMDYPTADYLSVVNKRFISELMPQHPIYIPLLPEGAQAVIGEVHANTRPGLALLQGEGFEITDMVDIFEAGACRSLRCGGDSRGARERSRRGRAGRRTRRGGRRVAREQPSPRLSVLPDRVRAACGAGAAASRSRGRPRGRRGR